MGHIRERKLKNGGVRYQAEVRLKGHRTLVEMFNRKTDVKAWISKVETDMLEVLSRKKEILPSRILLPSPKLSSVLQKI